MVVLAEGIPLVYLAGYLTVDGILREALEDALEDDRECNVGE